MPVAALAAPIMAAASTVTLSGLAMGATIVGTGMQLVGMATGSKTLQKIGTGFSMAGGVGLAAGGISNMMSASSAATGATKSRGLLSVADDLATPLNGRAKDAGLATFNRANPQTSSMDDFIDGSNKIGGKVDKSSLGFDPELEKNFFQRAGNTLTQYNPMMNVLGGMGEAYMMNERMDLERELTDKRVNIDQQRIDMINRNNVPLPDQGQPIQFSRNMNAYTGLLGR